MKPIGTAPHDGSPVLLHMRDRDHWVIGRWQKVPHLNEGGWFWTDYKYGQGDIVVADGWAPLPSIELE